MTKLSMFAPWQIAAIKDKVKKIKRAKKAETKKAAALAKDTRWRVK